MICGNVSPVAPHYCRAAKRCSKNEKPLGLPIPSIINLIGLFVIDRCWWYRTVFKTAKVDYSFRCFGIKTVSVVDVFYFSGFDVWKKLKKIKIKKNKRCLTKRMVFWYILFRLLRCQSEAQLSKLVFEIKGKGKKKKPKSEKILGKEISVEQRIERERGCAGWWIIALHCYFFFLIKVNVPKNKRNGTCFQNYWDQTPFGVFEIK